MSTNRIITAAEDGCPICNAKLEFEPADRSSVPMIIRCVNGCKQYHNFYHGMGDADVSVGNKFFVFGYGGNSSYDEYLQTILEVRKGVSCK